MSASEDLQSAVQPAASEALEGFPLSPLQTRAWRRHAERPENTVVGVRLHAPADPVATLERLRRALDGAAPLRVAYRARPGMSLPVQVLGGPAGWLFYPAHAADRSLGVVFCGVLVMTITNRPQSQG
ncbi:hypothetical protein ACLI37_31775, partial [Pseudomonas aeruginosa]